MSHAFVFSLVAALLGATSIPAIAVPVTQSQPPPSSLGLQGNQWRDSTLLMEALELLKKGDRPAAKVKLAQFLKQNPKDPRGSELAGMLFMEDKNYPVAVLSFERSLALKPNNPATLAKLGVALLLQDKKKEAEDKFNKAIALNPGEPLARRYLGWIEENQGNLDAAGRHYEASLKASAFPPGILTELHIALARIHGSLGRNDAVVKLLAPNIPKAATGEMAQAARFQLAYAYVNLNNDDAEPLLNSLEKELKPDNPELRYLKALMQFESNPTATRPKLQELLKSHPAYEGRARFLVARSYAMEGKPDLAVKELETLAAKAEKRALPEIMTSIASIYLAAGKNAEAANKLEAYAKQHPDIGEIGYVLAEVRYQSGELPAAQKLLSQLTVKQPSYARAFALLGQIERDQKAYPQAEEHLNKAIALDATLPNAWVNLAGTFAGRKDVTKAEATLKQGLVAIPGHPLIQYELARLYDQSGRAQDAGSAYRTLLAEYPTYVPALANIAVNLADRNDLAGAKKYAEQAYKLSKTNPAVLESYGWVLVQSKDTVRGLPMLEQAASAAPKSATAAYHLGSALIANGRADDGKKQVQRALAGDLPDHLREKAKALAN
jgi:cellulose synthase operon protein C